MLRVFIGYDNRQPISYNVLQQSIFTRSSMPVSITPLVINQLPIKRMGLTPFTYSRFLVPWLCGYKGVALFLDIDMLLLGDVAKLFELHNPRYAVQVSKNEKRFEWASAMLFNCDKCRILTPEFIDNPNNNGLHSIQWAAEEEIGSLPAEWNHLVGYDTPRSDAKLVHYTQGIPAHEEIGKCEYSDEWHAEHLRLNSTMPWKDLMGNSVHATTVKGELMPKLKAQQDCEGAPGTCRIKDDI
jgi:hypothetical protein